MWRQHFADLYNSVSTGDEMESLCSRIMDDCTTSCFALTIQDIRDACRKQKCGKAVGLDNVAMEAIMHGGDRLLVHICSLFNIFLNFSFVLEEFMRCVIIPLVKNKSDDLSAVNN